MHLREWPELAAVRQTAEQSTTFERSISGAISCDAPAVRTAAVLSVEGDTAAVAIRRAQGADCGGEEL
jgi:hypothetical protein